MHPATLQLLGFFAFAHLPEGKLRNTSQRFHDLAHELVESIPDSPEKTVMLRKLLEAKDCAVRSCLIPPKVDE